MGRTLGTLITVTTYGTWLRGDQRGWVDDGIVYPPDPILEHADRKRMKHPTMFFEKVRCQDIGQMIGESLQQRQSQIIHALTVQTWHVHLVIGPTSTPIPLAIKCLKDAVRWGLRLNRPLWSDGYDKRFCFDRPVLHNRVRYVERHNERDGLPAKPWSFITELMVRDEFAPREQFAPRESRGAK